jgi:hypothetical protein
VPPIDETIERLKRQAEELRARAAAVSSPAIRAEYLKMALDYEKLAQSLEHPLG